MTAYRSAEPAPRCSSCGGSSLTPSTKFDTSEGYAKVYFENTKVEPSFFGGSGTITFAIDRARVCLDCGHVMLGFSKERLEGLRHEMASLKPILP
jgi:hypothetical protein